MPSSPHLTGPNAGYVSQLLEQYLENPEAVDPAWRQVFENADAEELSSALPGLARLATPESTDGGNGAAAVAVVPPPAAPEPAAVAVPESTTETPSDAAVAAEPQPRGVAAQPESLLQSV